MPSGAKDRLSVSVQPVRERTLDSLSSPATILLIDDNPDVAQAIRLAFAGAGHRVDTAVAPEEAFSALARRRYDAILLDLNFTQGQTSGVEGFACLARILADDPAAAVVVITAHSGVRIAVAAMQTGALDFVMKPWRNADLIARVEAAIAKRLRPGAPLEAGPQIVAGQPRLLGESPAIVEARAIIRKIAPTRASVLITGPSGAGRSLAAQLIHEGSPFADDPATMIDTRDPDAWERIGGCHRYADPAVSGRTRRGDARPVARPAARPIAADRSRRSAGPSDIAAAQRGRHHRACVAAAFRAGERRVVARPALCMDGGGTVMTSRCRCSPRRPNPSSSRSAGMTMCAGWPRRSSAPCCWTKSGRSTAQRWQRGWCRRSPRPHPRPPVAPLDVSLWDSERVMIEAALRHHGHNVSKAAAALGLSRPALYRRMTRYGL